MFIWALNSRLSPVWLERPAVDLMAVTGRSPVQIREAGLFQNINYRKHIYEYQMDKQKSYKELLNLPNNLKEKLPTSYDVIGNILILKLNPELLNFKAEIGSTLLKTNKNIKTICLTEPVKGELRTRDMEIIAGEKSTETIHKEFGLYKQRRYRCFA